MPAPAIDMRVQLAGATIGPLRRAIEREHASATLNQFAGNFGNNRLHDAVEFVKVARQADLQQIGVLKQSSKLLQDRVRQARFPNRRMMFE